MPTSLPPGLAGMVQSTDDNQRLASGRLAQFQSFVNSQGALQKLQLEQQFRAELSQAKTPEEQSMIAAKYAGPQGLLAHIDRQDRMRASQQQQQAVGRLSNLLASGGFQGNAEQQAEGPVSPPTAVAPTDDAALAKFGVTRGPDGKLIQSGPAAPPMSVNVPNTANVQALAVQADPKAAIPALMRNMQPQTGGNFTLGPNQTRYANGQPVASGPQVGVEKPSKFTNIQPDGKGGYQGFNAATGQMERIPSAAGVSSDTANLEGSGLAVAVERYKQDGTFPPNLGRGTQGALNTQKILKGVADSYEKEGKPLDALRANQLAAKANTSALMDLSKRESQVGAFERTFTKNMQLVEGLSEKVDRDTNSPLLDKWIQSGKRAVGPNPDLRSLDVAIKGAVNEYTKIVSGSMGNTALAEGEIKKIESLLSAAQTKEDVKAVLRTMKVETQNRMSGFKEQKQELMDNFKGGSPLPAPLLNTPTTSPAWDDSKEQRYQELLRKRNGS